MSDLRAVPLDRAQVALLEELGEELLRRRDERAPKVLAIVLAWRFAGRPVSFEEPESENVVELPGWSKRVGA